MLRIHSFSIFTINTPRALNREDTDKCTLSCYILDLSMVRPFEACISGIVIHLPWVPFYYSTYANCKVTQLFPIVITFKPLIMYKKKKR